MTARAVLLALALALIAAPSPASAHAAPRLLRLFTTYYCLRGRTASGRLAGPGVVASYLLPWGAHVRDLATGWTGYVLDHPDGHTQADEWLPCPRRFPTGLHLWRVLGR